MLKKSTTLSDWIILDVPETMETEAKIMRAGRDQRYGNIYSEYATDARWVGDLGEAMLNAWLIEQGLVGLKWVKDEAAGNADFITGTGVRIGAKTVKRLYPPKLEYTAQVTARHASEPVHWFFFMTYVIARKKLWLLGGIETGQFLKQAKYYPAGSAVHENYIIRPGHEIYNIELTKLNTPRSWVSEIVNP